MKKINVMVRRLLLLSLTSLPVAAVESTLDCPTNIAGMQVHPDAKLCQKFDSTKQRGGQSMSYFVPQPPQTIIQFYQQQNLNIHSSFNQYTLMTDASHQQRVVISSDASGSQIDILVL